MIVKTEIRTLIRNEETGEEIIKQDELIRCKNCKWFIAEDESGGHCSGDGSYITKSDFCSNALKKEEPKLDAEAFIDNLLETLVLRSKSLEFTDMWAISNTMLGYVDGKKAMIKDVIKIIKDYKEKK